MATITFSMASVPLNGSKVFTGTDADMQALLDWATVAYNDIIQAQFNTPPVQGFVPTNGQIGQALAMGTMRAWKDAVQHFKQQPQPAAPPPITFA